MSVQAPEATCLTTILFARSSELEACFVLCQVSEAERCDILDDCAEVAAEPESKGSGKGAGSFLAGAAVNGLYTGLKFTGLAVRVASGLAASIGKDAEAAMARSRAAQQAQRSAEGQVGLQWS